MTNFHYRALDSSKKVLTGQLDASSQSAAAEKLRQKGLTPLKVSTNYDWRSGFSLENLFSSGVLTPNNQIHVLRMIASLLDSGMPLDSALSRTAETLSKKNARAVVLRIRGAVQDGTALAPAFEIAGTELPKYAIGLVRAAETSGSLAQMLDELADFMEERQAIASEITSALIYPLLLIVLTISTVVLFLTVLLPQFADYFHNSQAEIPWFTGLLITLGIGLRDNSIVLWIAVLFLLLVIRLGLAHPPTRFAVDRRILAVPFVGNILKMTEIARFFRTLGLLLGRGVPTLTSLKTAEEGLENAYLRHEISKIEPGIRGGDSFYSRAASTNLFPPLCLQFIAMGEQSGRLPDMLSRAAQMLEKDVEIITKRLLSLLVPVLTILTGGLVAFVVGSILTALMSVYDVAI